MNSSQAPPSENPEPITWRSWLSGYGFQQLYGIDADEQHLFDGLTWSPGDADRIAAWKLYTELRTRITTQPLAYRAGDEETALDSVYRLFDLSRTIVKEHTGCTHFATLTIRVLNEHVRPFTAKWHRAKVDGRLSSADVRFLFRRELAALQPFLRQLTHLLGLLSGDSPVIAEAEGKIPEPILYRAEALWRPLPFGIASGTPGTDNIREELNATEANEIRERRKFYSLNNAAEAIDAVGLSISGGGIRSATFALGVVNLLARKGILRHVDYLSTVSGGGYLGAFISSFLNDQHDKISLKAEAGALPFGGAGDPESQAVRQVRNHSKYLTEGGVKTLATMVALFAYGILVSVMLLSPLILFGVTLTVLFFRDSFQNGNFVPLSLPTVLVLLVLAVGLLCLPVAHTLGRGQKLHRWWESGCLAIAVLSVLFLIFEALPYLYNRLSDDGISILIATAAALPLVLGALGLWLGAESRLGRVMFALFACVGPFLIFATFLWVANRVLAYSAPNTTLLLIFITILLALYTSFVLNINFASPHPFYRNRLARTYLTRSTAGGAVVPCDPQLLSEMNSCKKAPYHLINCAVNIPHCKDPNLRGRNTDFFLFSKYYCGSPIVGFRETKEWEAMDSHLDLGTAMAISGAAAAPRMGTLSSARYTFLLAMLNVRLGYWLRRPMGNPIKRIERFLPPVGWYYFFLELTGLMSEKTRYLNLSDGGHIENLGIYELLRRRCKFVIAIDGEADPKRSFGGLLTLTQLAKIDLGVSIEPDLADLRMDRDGKGRAHFGLSYIRYPDQSLGLLLYVKSSLTGNEPEFLKKYRDENPDFPHQSTAQQLFSETQFEAYRALGEHIASDLFREDLVNEWQPDVPVREWFARLTLRLLHETPGVY